MAISSVLEHLNISFLAYLLMNFVPELGPRAQARNTNSPDFMLLAMKCDQKNLIDIENNCPEESTSEPKFILWLHGSNLEWRQFGLISGS